MYSDQFLVQRLRSIHSAQEARLSNIRYLGTQDRLGVLAPLTKFLRECEEKAEENRKRAERHDWAMDDQT